ncbi:ATP synthase protein I [Nocardioides daedukensis]|uniref:ATP synthase protein I n=1 Tax=Nocardioides daedukensis TaxID=634462 RepID=A0A7Y9UUD4_9ACTN|nr:hypothetical protein [Nocardioides daedukensis]NYG60584.1 ATP synthase protein I [Nocardioides daedukensis]
MTTELKRSSAAHGGSALLGAGLTALVLGLGTALVGVLVSGSSALLGALIGTAIIIGVFGTGALAVDLISRTMPTMSLLVALMTYLLQVIGMGLIFVALKASGALDSAVDARWLGGVVIAGTLVWLTVQVVLATRLRLPVYDLKDAGER